MPAFTSAQPPSAVVTEIPGRYAPLYIVNKQNPASMVNSTPTNSVASLMYRCESVDAQLDTKTTPVTELGTNLNVGEFDDLPDSKLKIMNYDVGTANLGLITAKPAALHTTTTWTYSDLATAQCDFIRQFCDPNGNVFASAYMSDMLVEDYTASLKAKSAAEETYSFAGFNMLMFRGFFIPKAYTILAADATNNNINLLPLLGANEAPVALPVPTGSQPASYWIQRGCYNFVKVDRWRSGQGWGRIKEQTSAPAAKGNFQYTATSTTVQATVTGSGSAQSIQVASSSGMYIGMSLLVDTVASGKQETVVVTAIADGTHVSGIFAQNHAISAPIVGNNLRFFAGDLVAGDVFIMTYASYGSSVAGYSAVAQTSGDTSDPVAISTRLTPFTISANNIPRGTQLDLKLAFKRDRAEGVGDVDGIYGPPDAPQLDVTLDVKTTDMSLGTILTTGLTTGTDGGNTVMGDFIDPNYITRTGLVSAVPIVASLNDPRNSGTVVKTITCPTVVMKNWQTTIQSKSIVTTKLTGSDRVGNISIAVTLP